MMWVRSRVRARRCICVCVLGGWCVCVCARARVCVRLHCTFPIFDKICPSSFVVGRFITVINVFIIVIVYFLGLLFCLVFHFAVVLLKIVIVGLVPHQLCLCDAEL